MKSSTRQTISAKSGSDRGASKETYSGVMKADQVRYTTDVQLKMTRREDFYAIPPSPSGTFTGTSDRLFRQASIWATKLRVLRTSASTTRRRWVFTAASQRPPKCGVCSGSNRPRLDQTCGQPPVVIGTRTSLSTHGSHQRNESHDERQIVEVRQ